MQLFLGLDPLGQLEHYEEVRRYLGPPPLAVDDELVAQGDSLRCLVCAMQHLGLRRPLQVAEYRDAASELGLEWSWQRIHRLWGSFAAAAQRAAGGRPVTTAQQRDFIRFYNRRSGREEPLTAVRRWLATDPPKLTGAAFDAWAREYNNEVAAGVHGPEAEPLPRAATIYDRLALTWTDVLRSAQGQVPLAEAASRRRAVSDWSRGPHDLIARATIARDYDRSLASARLLLAEPHFPRPALVINGRRAWLRDEVEAYLRGERVPLKEANRLRGEYLTTNEVAEMFAVAPAFISGRRQRLVSPAGRVGYSLIWHGFRYSPNWRATLARLWIPFFTSLTGSSRTSSSGSPSRSRSSWHSRSRGG